MFQRPIVFVLGAGASNEFGFPLGTELAGEVQRVFNLTDNGVHLEAPAMDLIMEAAKISCYNPNQYMEPAKAIFGSIGYFKSVDDFLDQRRGDKLLIQIAKMAIARIILQREVESDLAAVNPRPLPGSMGNKWLFKFVQMLVRGCPLSEIAGLFKNVTFITFNYDRSLEQFLIIAIGEACSIGREEATRIVSSVPIHHVYGSLGKLPGFTTGSPVVYGARASTASIAQISQGIRTYTESVADNLEAASIKTAVENARKLVFLGCGFHEQNMGIRKPLTLLTDGTKVAATAYRQTDMNILTICDRIAILFGPPPYLDKSLHDRKCSELFDEYSLGLTD